MKYIIFYLSLVVTPLFVVSQDSSGRIDEGFLKTVVHITIPTNPPTIGTGFLIGVNVGSIHNIIYLVTAKHMIGEYSLVTPFFLYDSIIVDFYSKPDNAPTPTTLKLSEKGRMRRTVRLHPDSRIDVAIINVSDIFNDNHLYGHANDITYLQRLKNLPQIDLGFGSQVFAIGYPSNVMIAGTNEPIGKSGYIASSLSGKLEVNLLLEDKFKRQIPTRAVGSFFLVDGLIIGGNSGGPIVIPKEVKTRLKDGQMEHTAGILPNLIIGIVSMVMSGTGIAIVYSSDNILDLINKDIKENYPQVFSTPH